MKQILFSFMFLIVFDAKSQNVSINNDGSSPDANAILDVKSTTKGVLLPRMTETERGNINLTGNVPLGLIVFQTDATRGLYYNGSSLPRIPDWKKIAESSESPWQYTSPRYLYTPSPYNVGIGSAIPLMALHVSRATDTALLLLENQAALGSSSNVGMYFKNGNYYTGAIKTIGTSSDSSRLGLFTFASGVAGNLKEGISLLNNGNAGIGITAPTEKLQVEGGNVKIGNAPWTAGNDHLLKFGDADYVTIGEAGVDDFMQLKANKYHFTKNNGGITYVGINNPNPIYAMDVTGQIHTTSSAVIDGTIKIAGGNPAVGKVLTSDANGNATWKSQAYGNTERFLMNTYNALGSPSYDVEYNLGSATINVNTGEVTISKAGLYHLEAKFIAIGASDYVQNGTNPRTANLFLSVNGSLYNNFASGKPFYTTQIITLPGGYTYSGGAEFSNSIDIQVPAGSVLKVVGVVPNGSARFSGSFSGDLISE